jgi:hypothetical protein
MRKVPDKALTSHLTGAPPMPQHPCARSRLVLENRNRVTSSQDEAYAGLDPRGEERGNAGRLEP